MEKRDLYNENKQLLNKTILKNEKTPENCYILIVVIFIQNNKDEFLIQKRSELKDGKWAFTGGHPKAGENSLTGIITEVKEELGLDIENPILFKEMKDSNSFCDLYYLKQDVKLDDVIMQEEEVTAVKYATREEIDEMYEDGIFKKGHYMMFNELLKYLDANLKKS